MSSLQGSREGGGPGLTQVPTATIPGAIPGPRASEPAGDNAATLDHGNGVWGATVEEVVEVKEEEEEMENEEEEVERWKYPPF